MTRDGRRLSPREIDQPPARGTVGRRDRAALDHLHNRLALHIISVGSRAAMQSSAATKGGATNQVTSVMVRS
jgi:hypothetical protein